MKFENQTFTGKTISLDYNRFIDCAFHDSTLVLHGGAWSLNRAKFTGKTNFKILGPAAGVVDFMKVTDC